MIILNYRHFDQAIECLACLI